MSETVIAERATGREPTDERDRARARAAPDGGGPRRSSPQDERACRAQALCGWTLARAHARSGSPEAIVDGRVDAHADG
jgi:hypothetical protein